ncbi:MAG: CsgG/HfaB family protein [Trueperaceae bacterium]|nr:CsgG/HfaB family protein [Trueperaceae bacterium]
MHRSSRPALRRLALPFVAAVALLAACAPAAQPGPTGLEVRAFGLPPLAAQARYLVAVYDVETDPTRVDVTLLPARERDERLFTELGSGIGDIVTRELFELDRFDLVERRNLAAILAEQDLGQSDRFDPATAANVGRLVGADLILVGAVTELSIDRSSAVVPGFLGGATVTTVAVEVELRFVDVATGRILGLGTGRGVARDAEVSVDAVQQALRLLRVGTVRQSIVAVALRNAIREAVEAAAGRLPSKGA